MSNSKNRAVMMLVSRRVKPGYEAEFERLMEQFIDAAANFPGCLGAQLVSPGDEVDVEDSLYQAVLESGGCHLARHLPHGLSVVSVVE